MFFLHDPATGFTKGQVSDKVFTRIFESGAIYPRVVGGSQIRYVLTENKEYGNPSFSLFMYKDDYFLKG